MNMNTEPVAIRYDFDGYGYQYMDSGSGSDWLTRVDGELLYTHPADESFDRTASHMAGEYVSYPAKTLTDEEIIELFADTRFDAEERIQFARAILKKASEK
jgi:hypothetical protein